MKFLEATVTQSEIREAWATIQRGQNPFSPKQDRSCTVVQIDRYRGSKVNPWVGASGAQIQDRLENGYTPEGAITADLRGRDEYAAPTMWLDEEEGDLLLDQAINGEDMYRVQWEDQSSPKSLTIRANIGFSANVEAVELGRYLEWILKVADAARQNGAVPSIELTVTLRESFVGSKDRLQILIPLVEAGEVVDETAWRAYLAPGAFRSLGFVAIGIAADKLNRSLTSGLGYPTNKDWNVTLEDDVLSITCPGSMGIFPEATLDIMLETATAV